MATNAANLKAAKASLIEQLRIETAYCEVYGPKPSYSLDGESYQWTEWRTAVLEQIKNLNVVIQQEQPFWHSMRGRS